MTDSAEETRHKILEALLKYPYMGAAYVTREADLLFNYVKHGKTVEVPAVTTNSSTGMQTSSAEGASATGQAPAQVVFPLPSNPDLGAPTLQEQIGDDAANDP